MEKFKKKFKKRREFPGITKPSPWVARKLWPYPTAFGASGVEGCFPALELCNTFCSPCSRLSTLPGQIKALARVTGTLKTGPPQSISARGHGRSSIG